MSVAPSSDIDIYSDAVLADPYEAYRELRDLAPVVYLPKYDVYAVSRYADVKPLLGNWQDYTSRFGISAEHETPEGAALIFSDPPAHDEMRNVASRPIRPVGLKSLEGELQAEAEDVAAEIVAGQPVDAVAKIAQRIPVSIISKLVGLPEDGRERMLEWATAGFNMNGPNNPRKTESEPIARQMIDYVLSVDRDRMREGSWGRALFDAVDAGELKAEYMPGLLLDYVAPSLDTTIAGITNALWCLATNPEQWGRLRREPELMTSAINEVARLTSPVLGFARVSTKDTVIDGIDVAKGSRLMALYASANRDERKWDRPEEFIIDRKPNDHVAFGYGIHSCMGMHLAKLEMKVILTALLARFEGIELLGTEMVLNNSLRTFSKLDVQFS